MRPACLVLVAGTGTEVGKTWWAARTCEHLRASGARVAARKPTQSFMPGDGPTDAEVLASATGEATADVCPQRRSFEVPMAPPMAAAVLGRDAATIRELARLTWPAPAVDVGLVESAGGPRSPLAPDGDTVDLARLVEPDVVVLVADAGLGTINAVRLGVAALAGRPIVVALNRFDAADDLHARNRAWLAERDRFTVVVEPAELAAVLHRCR